MYNNRLTVGLFLLTKPESEPFFLNLILLIYDINHTRMLINSYFILNMTLTLLIKADLSSGHGALPVV